MEKEEINTWLNWITQGILLTFLFVLTLFLLGERHDEHLRFDDHPGLIFFSLIVPTISSWLIMRKSKNSTFLGCILFTLISAGLLYMFVEIRHESKYYYSSSTKDTIVYFKYTSFLIFCALQVLAWVIIKYQQPLISNYFNSELQSEPNQQLTPTPIQLPLSKKISIIRLLLLLKKTSPLSKNSTEVNDIIDNYAKRLNLSYKDTNKIINNDFFVSPHEILSQISHDIHYLNDHHNTAPLKQNCERIAQISTANEAQDIITTLFNNVESPTNDEKATSNVPHTIARDLREAPIQLLALLQGASPKSAFSEECNDITQRYATRLGFDKSDLEQIVLSSMRNNPTKIIDDIKSNIEELSNHFSLNNFYRDCRRIVEISEEQSGYEIMDFVFDNISVAHN